MNEGHSYVNVKEECVEPKEKFRGKVRSEGSNVINCTNDTNEDEDSFVKEEWMYFIEAPVDDYTGETEDGKNVIVSKTEENSTQQRSKRKERKKNSKVTHEHPLRSLQKVLPDKVKSLKCCHCDISFGNKTMMARHMKKEHAKRRPRDGRSYNLCKEKDILEEQVVSIPKKIKSLKCRQCNLCFRYKSKLSAHNRLIHKNELPHKCSDCGYSNFMKGQLFEHIIAVHTKEKLLCKICNASFSWNNSLIKHVKTVHSKLKPLNCSECNFSSTRKDSLARHWKRKHEKEKPFKCGSCGFSCGYKNTFTKHVNKFHII